MIMALFILMMISLHLRSIKLQVEVYMYMDGSYEVRIRACVTLIDVGLKSILHARKDHS